ncbi:hypothetical protein EVAR_59334_1 [Eumeta japonica]|uniref:Uncharacterized protein n=1 Tax=Eumeta variegata TaxID=151549 RepID=A0A4C1Z6E1_EUMVA|nr:hypothetical protein EVAR_59334_1 [Eumeta japonica]
MGPGTKLDIGFGRERDLDPKKTRAGRLYLYNDFFVTSAIDLPRYLLIMILDPGRLREYTAYHLKLKGGMMSDSTDKQLISHLFISFVRTNGGPKEGVRYALSREHASCADAFGDNKRPASSSARRGDVALTVILPPSTQRISMNKNNSARRKVHVLNVAPIFGCLLSTKGPFVYI